MSWEKVSLTTELRKELRLSEDENRELLTRAGADENVRRIREWRQTQTVSLNKAQTTHDTVPSRSMGPPASSVQPSSSAAKLLPAPGEKRTKLKPGQLPGGSQMKYVQYPATLSTIRDEIANKSSATVPSAPYNPLTGRKVAKRMPVDNFYDAVPTDHNPTQILPDDIRWEGDDPSTVHLVNQEALGRGFKKATGQDGGAPSAGKGKDSLQYQFKKEFPLPQNAIGVNGTNEIKILHTETLTKEAEMILSSDHPNPLEMRKAKKNLKEQERLLVEALSKLDDALDGASEDDQPQFSHRQENRDHGWRNHGHRDNHEENPGGYFREGYEGIHMACSPVASEYQHDDDDI